MALGLYLALLNQYHQQKTTPKTTTPKTTTPKTTVPPTPTTSPQPDPYLMAVFQYQQKQKSPATTIGEGQPSATPAQTTGTTPLRQPELPHRHLPIKSLPALLNPPQEEQPILPLRPNMSPMLQEGFTRSLTT